MKIRKLFEFGKISKLLAAFFGMVICLKYAAECSEGIRKGIMFCIEVLVPSLFLFMALSSAVIRSGVMRTLTKPLSGVSRLLFRLPPPGLAAVLLSILGGYPVGARCAAMLYEHRELSMEEAQKTAFIAVCAGPGFLVNYIGIALLHSRRAGMILLVAEITGVLITGVLIGRMMASSPLPHYPPQARSGGGSLLISSVADASRATFQMCGMVVICSAVIEVIDTVSPRQSITDIAAALTEITEGCHRMCGAYPLYLTAFFIGFGGIAVHLQIFAGLGDLPLNKGLFFLFRIIQGIITAAAAYIYLMVFPVEQSVFSTTDAPLTVSKSAAAAGSAALILSSLCFLGSIHKTNALQHEIIRR